MRFGFWPAAGLAVFTTMAVGTVTMADQSSQPAQTVPEAAGSGSSTLSHQLDRSGGVIRPPGGVDADMTQPPPAVGTHSMPVVPPPGTPGGNPTVAPK